MGVLAFPRWGTLGALGQVTAGLSITLVSFALGVFALTALPCVSAPRRHPWGRLVLCQFVLGKIPSHSPWLLQGPAQLFPGFVLPVLRLPCRGRDDRAEALGHYTIPLKRDMKPTGVGRNLQICGDPGSALVQ